jgi:hypothetical protein
MEKRNWRKEAENRRISVVINGTELVGVWGNLKKLCEEMKVRDADFLAYPTLARRRLTENPMRFSTSAGSYSVWVVNIREGRRGTDTETDGAE